ncbi:kanadaptin isoform 2-T2 [Discoglossus pictus]
METDELAPHGGQRPRDPGLEGAEGNDAQARVSGDAESAGAGHERERHGDGSHERSGDTTTERAGHERGQHGNGSHERSGHTTTERGQHGNGSHERSGDTTTERGQHGNGSNERSGDTTERPCTGGASGDRDNKRSGDTTTERPNTCRASGDRNNERAGSNNEGACPQDSTYGGPSTRDSSNERSITRSNKIHGSPINEGTRITGPGSDERTTTTGARVSRGYGVPGSSSNEGPSITRANVEKQRTARPSSTQDADASQPDGERVPSTDEEATFASRTSCSEESTSSGASSGQEPGASGSNSNQELNAPGSREKWNDTASTDGERSSRTSIGDGSHECQTTPSRGSTMEGTSRATDSFKKPISPACSTGNEKTVEPRSKPAKSSSPTSATPHTRASSTEATPDASHGLPSDAYRSSPAIPYREPSWSGLPTAFYSLEILKGGSIVSTKSLDDQSWTLVGRLPGCHVSLDHPSVSRYHAVLQYRQVPGSEPDQEPGFYIYDLGSTHGTFLNKQRIQSKTYCRFRVGHVLKFGGSTRLFILQGPEDDQESESELTVTQIKEARRQREELQKKMLGDDSDEEDLTEDRERSNAQSGSGEDGGCMWGMGEDALEDENDENPIALEFQEEKEALYLKNPKKALQGFFDREGEELEFEYEEQGGNTWLCRVKLPVNDSQGKQLIADAIHSGKKKEAAVQCALEACRILDSRGLLRQEAVSRKRKSKQWEDEDYYDSDDDTFLDRTGLVEKKRLNRMKKAGKIEEKPETYDSLVAKLKLVEEELAEIATKLQTSQTDDTQSSAQDSLDAFMTEIKSGHALDGVSRKKLHIRSFELKKEQQRLKGLIKIVQPTKLPELSPATEDPMKKKPQLPMFGAMKGGRKCKLKTGTVGKLPPKRTDLPASFFNMKEDSNEPEEEDDEEEQEQHMQVEATRDPDNTQTVGEEEEDRTGADVDSHPLPSLAAVTEETSGYVKPKKHPKVSSPGDYDEGAAETTSTVTTTDESKQKNVAAKQKKMQGPSRPPQNTLPTRYPEDDPDYCVWTPPAGQTGDGKTHLNEKYGY